MSEDGASPIVGDAEAPIIYADFLLGGAAAVGDNFTLSFATNILDHSLSPPTGELKMVLRLVLPRTTLQTLADFAQALAKRPLDQPAGPFVPPNESIVS